jgi:choice-of-anchor A domain-containing protein
MMPPVMRICAPLLLALLAAFPASAALSSGDFQVFSLSSIALRHGDFEGRTGAAADAGFTHFELGAKEKVGPATLIVGGSATLVDGSVLNGPSRGGDVRAGKKVRHWDVGEYGHFFEHSNDAAELAGVSDELLEDSASLAALAPNASESWSWDDVRRMRILVLAADPDAARSVIEMTADSLAAARAVILTVPAGRALVVNVTGPSASLSDAKFEQEGAGGIVFNFHDANELMITGVAVPGVILAPRAKTSFFSGQIDGRLYVGDLPAVDHGQVNETGTLALSWALSGISGAVPAAHPRPALPRQAPGICGVPSFDGPR